MESLSRKRLGEALCLVLLGATGIALLVGSASLPDPMFDPLGPAGMPQYIGYLLLAFIVLRIILIVQESNSAPKPERKPIPGVAKDGNMLGAGERGLPRADDVDAPQITRLLLVMGITLVYLVGLTKGGFPFTWITLVYLAAVGAAMSEFTPRRFMIVGAIAVIMSFALTYTFTDILSVILPE